MMVRQASIDAILAAGRGFSEEGWTISVPAGYRDAMCRSIKTLRRPEPATSDEVRAAALQFVRKVSGYRVPSRANSEIFEATVDEIAAASQRMLDSLTTRESAVHSH
jgi:hypothetical protein